MKLLTSVERYWAACTLCMLVAITVLSLSPLPRLPEAPGDDKTLHVVAYAALMLPVALRRPRRWIFLGLFFVAYSGVIELVQPCVNRHGEWKDMLANAAGVLCGLLLADVMRRLTRTNALAGK